jgi:glycine cleavage system aminomethyltransferase T
MKAETSPFLKHPASPFYPEFGLYNLRAVVPRPWEFNGWKTESLSWKRSCYIHGGLSGPGQFVFTGPDAEQFLSSICINNFSKFKVGAAKHAVMCDDGGLITGHGVLQRLAADKFRIYACAQWPLYMHSKTKLNVTRTVENNYLLQVAGPTSLQTLESACGESLRDVAFLRFKNVKIAGRLVEVMRIGMAGSLAYELHGPMDDGPDVYDAVFHAGQEFGIERLGWKTYFVNHVEGGFPQQTWTFLSAAYRDEGFLDFIGRDNVAVKPIVTGSVDPREMRARFRTPVEVGWQSSIKLDHEFIGRAALEQELAAPKRTVVTLVWKPEDVVDIYASLFRPGEEYKEIELPISPHNRGIMAHADHVLKDGKTVGVSSGTVYSYYYRQLLSLCTIDIGSSAIGTEVTVLWGDFGGKIKEVRARVERFPYLNEGRNQDVDVTRLDAAKRPVELGA